MFIANINDLEEMVSLTEIIFEIIYNLLFRGLQQPTGLLLPIQQSTLPNKMASF